MLDNIIFSINAVMPLVLMIFFGTFIRTRTSLFPDPKAFFGQLEKFVFNIALPVYLFNVVARAEIRGADNIRLVVYCIAAIILTAVVLSFVSPLYIKSKQARGAYINGISRPNFVILGVPLVYKLTEGSGAAFAALVLPFVVLLFNALGVVVLTLNAEEAQTNGLRSVFTGIGKNPLIRALVLGLLFMLLGIELPEVAQRTLNSVGATATPLALISLGAGINLLYLKSRLRLALSAVVIKTVICPIVFLIPAMLLGFNNDELVTIYVLAAAPSAVASYITAQNMNSDAYLAGQILTLTTVVCPITIFIGSLVLRSIGVI